MTLVLEPSQYGEGWAPVGPDQVIQTLDQWVNPQTKSWVITGFVTSDGFKTRPGTNYRRPVSLWAKTQSLLPLAGKLWRRWRDRAALKAQKRGDS